MRVRLDRTAPAVRRRVFRSTISPEELVARRATWDRHRDRVSPQILERDGFHCVTCGSTEQLTVDHMTSIAHGGTDDPANLQTLCLGCNTRKNAPIIDIRNVPVIAEQIAVQSASPSTMPGTLDGAPSAAAMHVEAPLLAQLLADAQAELVRKAGAAAMWLARAEFLAGQLEQAQLALAAPKEPTPSKIGHTSDSVGVSVEPTQTPATAPHRAPWWRFW